MRAFFVFTFCLLLVSTLAAQDKSRLEESTDHYRRWLERDVVYIISEEERAVFRGLTTDEERDAFIEQFWRRRDPEPSTAFNEFKEEHYRRIAYANEHFTYGIEGWATERGRIYIVFGPPRHVDRNPTGGFYSRSGAEGGGDTMTYPYEVWRYDNIEGIGPGVELEFVDRSFNGDYRLALHPYEKDALIDKPGVGLTLAEEESMFPFSARTMPAVSKRNRLDALFMGRASDREGHTAADMTRQPFVELQKYFALRRPPEFRFKDLRETVSARVNYPSDPSFRVDFGYQLFSLDGNNHLVAAVFSIPLTDLEVRSHESGGSFAKVNIYGSVTDLSGVVQYEFEDALIQYVFEDDRPDAVCLYEKKLPLQSGRYKLTSVLKDEHSGGISVLEKSLHVPSIGSDQFALSSINLIRGMRKHSANLPLTDPFVIPGGVKAYPSLDGVFRKEWRRMTLGFEIYNFALAQDSGLPNLETSVRVFDKTGRMVWEEGLPSLAFQLVGNRIVVLHQIDLSRFDAGDYRIEVVARDAIRDQSVIGSRGFSVIVSAEVSTR